MAKGQTASYDVLRPLNHDGEQYKAGDTVELDADTAQTLIALGAVAAPKPAKAAPAKGAPAK